MHKRFKKSISFIVVLIFLLSVNLPAFAITLTGQPVNAKVYLNGQEIYFDPPPVKFGNFIFLPVTQFAKYLNANVSFFSTVVKMYNDDFSVYLPVIQEKTAGYVFNPYMLNILTADWDENKNALMLKLTHAPKTAVNGSTAGNRNTNIPTAGNAVTNSTSTRTNTANATTKTSSADNTAVTKANTNTNQPNTNQPNITVSLKPVVQTPVTVKKGNMQITISAKVVPNYKQTIVIPKNNTSNTQTSYNADINNSNNTNNPGNDNSNTNQQNLNNVGNNEEQWILTLEYSAPNKSVPVRSVAVNSDGYFGVKLDKSIFDNSRPEKLLCLADTPSNMPSPHVSVEPIVITDILNYRDGDVIKIPAAYGSTTYTVLIAENYKEERVSNGEVNITYDIISKYKVTPQDADKFKYLLPTTYVDSDNPVIVQTAKSIVNGITDEKEKVKAIHDFVKNKLTYDVNYAGYKNRPASLALQNGKAVCEGYSVLFSALSRAAGIPSQNIVGTVTYSNTTMSHMWNKVLVNGEWYFVDVTFDDAGWNYFLVKSCHGYDVNSVYEPF